MSLEERCQLGKDCDPTVNAITDSGLPEAAFPSDDQVVSRINADNESFQIWRHGFEWGLIEGADRQRLSDDKLADLAARIAISRIENHFEIKVMIRNTIRNIDVASAREASRRAVALPLPEGVPGHD